MRFVHIRREAEPEHVVDGEVQEPNVSEIESLVEEINRFRDERDWRQFHNAKDLALSVVLEASELLEQFQWVSAEVAIRDRGEALAEEIADVLIYALMLADDLGLDPATIVRRKLVANAERYPVAAARGRSSKYDRL